MTDKPIRRYKVGYKKTPEDTRFKPGQSGNPGGRPKGTRNLATEIEEELNACVPLTENGKRKKISQRKAIAKQLVRKAVLGDPKAIPIILSHDIRTQQAKTAAGMGQPTIVETADELVMERIVSRIRRAEDSLAAPEETAGDQTPATTGPEEGHR